MGNFNVTQEGIITNPKIMTMRVMAESKVLIMGNDKFWDVIDDKKCIQAITSSILRYEDAEMPENLQAAYLREVSKPGSHVQPVGLIIITL
jgi:serine/threonine protein phosphatase PrpC